MPLRSIMLVAALAAATPALAEEGRALCPDRPGLGTPACTVDVGAVVLEVGVADWTLDDNADSRTDSWAFGDTLLRARSEEHTSELQSLMRISYAVFCLKKKTNTTHKYTNDKRTIDE